MRRLLALLCLVLSAVALPVAPTPQANAAPDLAAPTPQSAGTLPTLTRRGGLGGSSTAVVVQDGRAYLGEGASIVVVDVSAPASPNARGSVALPGLASDLAVAGSILYVVSGYAGMQVVNVANPDAPTALAQLALPGSANAIQVVGNRAYIATSVGLQIVDVSTPASPRILGAFSLPADDLVVVGALAYVVGFYAGLQIIDVSNPAAPALRGRYAGPLTTIAVVGTRAYVGSLGGSSSEPPPLLLALDVQTPAAPKLLGSYSTGQIYSLQVVGDTAYIGRRGDVLELVDVSNPAALASRTTVNIPRFNDLQVVNGLAYLATEDRGLQIYDLAASPSPTLRGSYETLGGSLGGAQVVGNLVYTTGSIVDVSNPARPEVRGRLPKGVGDVQVVGNLAYAVGGTPASLQVLDITDPSSPSLRSSLPISGGIALEVRVVGTTAYVNAFRGLEIIDVSNPSQPVRRSYIGLKMDFFNVFYTTMEVSGEYVLIAAVYGGLRSQQVLAQQQAPPPYYRAFTVVRVTDPANPVFVPSPGDAQVLFPTHIAISGSAPNARSAIVTTADAVVQLDITDPARVVPGRRWTFGQTGANVSPRAKPYLVAATDTLAFVAVAYEQPFPPNRLFAIDLRSNTVGVYNVAGHVASILAQGNRVYLAGDYGLQILEVGSQAAATVYLPLVSQGQTVPSR